MEISSHKEFVLPGGHGRQRTRCAASFAALLTACVMAAGCATRTDRAPAIREAPISVVAVQLTAAGHYVDLRYRVLDPERAQLALGPQVRPQLINEANGAAMAVPTTAKLGSLRQTQAVQETGRTYFVLFVNSGGVQTGSRVTAELGEMRFEHLLVE